MKKFLWLLIILITITSILCLIKEKKEDKKIVIKFLLSIEKKI